MALRYPLSYVGGDFVEVGKGSDEMAEWLRWIIYNWSQRSLTLGQNWYLTYVASGGSALYEMNDTRVMAGTSTTRTDRFATRAETPDAGVNTVSYRRINQTTPSLISSQPANVPKIMYWNEGLNGMAVMTQQDIIDTFITPCINYLTINDTSAYQAGTYTVSTSSSITNGTLQGTIFTDTQANTLLYQASNIPETLDQPVINQNYYLHRINGDSTQPSRKHWVTATNWGSNINFGLSNFSDLTDYFVDLLVWAIYNDNGNRLIYQILTDTSPAGFQTARGTAMLDTSLDSSDYNTHQVDADDYRTQEFPGGSATTVSTYQLVISRT